MRYAQIKSGQKLHLVYEPGEGRSPQTLIPAGSLSWPLCGRRADEGFRMTIHVPLGNACKRCRAIYEKRHRRTISKSFPPVPEIDGEQHEDFEDTLP